MTRVYDEKGNATPVTVIEAGGNTVLQVKTTETDGYTAVQVGFDSQKEPRVTKPLTRPFQEGRFRPEEIRQRIPPAGWQRNWTAI